MNVYEALAVMSNGNRVKNTETGYTYWFEDLSHSSAYRTINSVDSADGYLKQWDPESFICGHYPYQFYEVST